MFLSLSLFLRKHVSSLAKSSCLNKSPPGCDNIADPFHVANCVVPLLKPLTSAVSPSLSDWLFLEQMHTVCAINAKSGKHQKKGKEKREVLNALCSVIYNMIAFINSYFISPWFDPCSGGDRAWGSHSFSLNPGPSVCQVYNLGQIT